VPALAAYIIWSTASTIGHNTAFQFLQFFLLIEHIRYGSLPSAIAVESIQMSTSFQPLLRNRRNCPSRSALDCTCWTVCVASGTTW